MLPGRLYLRRRRDRGWRFGYQAGDVTWEQAVEKGHEHVARLTRTLEAHTGSSLAGRHALDFGCGWGRFALPLAERCEHVYGLDVAPSVLQEAARNATRLNVGNVEWLDSGQLAELSGRYDLVISMYVLQHIPVREGERIFALLVGGLRPGGIGAIQVVLRPGNPWAPLLRLMTRAGPTPARRRSRLRALRAYRHTIMGAYSLDRLGRLLAAAGVTDWRVSVARTARPQAFQAVTIVFAKD
jgi:2-polyprenyl-3-methyl-5-hydroxy-6-metoxy-1,4-benzoquinol methylase